MTDVDKEGESYEFDASLTDEEREFYLKAYPSPEHVRDRKAHCTTCKVHIGTAPCNEQGIKMHPILRVTHCSRCHDFYNSGEFSKGEDGSELYCRWCGQGGEVYCCSNCPFVFCKSCITKNLSRGVVADIEQNENWRCFACAPKILWPLRALHWSLINYIEKQKKDIDGMNLSEADKKIELTKDRSTCCRLAKAKCGNMSDSMESVDSVNSRRSSSSHKKKPSTPSTQVPPAKRQKTSNDEVVCTPDLLSMLEPDCQITEQGKQTARAVQPVTTPKIFTVQQNYVPPQQHSSAPPPLVLRNTGIQLRPVANPPVIRRTVVSPRTPAPAGSNSPVYHTINGYRIDLNSAAQQGTYRLPNGKLIQVKRQSAPTAAGSNAATPPANNWPQSSTTQRAANALQPPSIARTVRIMPQRPYAPTQPGAAGAAPLQQPAQPVRYPSSIIGNTVISAFNNNGPQIQMINGAGAAAPQAGVAVRPAMMRHIFPDNQVGQARTRLQDQIFNAMEICQHLTGKLQTLTNSNAYKQARNLLEVKELYIHLSYLLTYAIGRYKGLQDKCLTDMRQLGFSNDADSLENGQIAAGIDYVRYGQLEDVELFTAGSNSFHNQIYEYRKSLLANLDDEMRAPLSPLYPLCSLNDEEETELAPSQEHELEHDHWQEPHPFRRETIEDDDDDVQEVPLTEQPSGQYMDSYADEDQPEEGDPADDDYYLPNVSVKRGTEDVMRREEESHAYDRKLTRLIEQYPSIWCTRHPDYGNFEVTRKQWRTIATHFKRSEDMKMRWKNIRKRYVRIERRMQEGKRFNGYFDKATNFLINRDTPMEEWAPVDCGTDDGDIYERKKLDAIEQELHKTKESEKKSNNDFGEPFPATESSEPIEINPLDMKIIHFVKCNPVLWRKSSDPTFNKMDEQTRKSLWMHLWKSVPNIRCTDLIDRWTQLYEMYKTFRLKTIKSENAMAALEIKYSKYLAKLYFLYKIDEDELQTEYERLVYGDDLKEDEVESDDDGKILDMPDDKEFVQQLMRTVREYPQIWNPNHVDYHDVQLRDQTWREIARRMERYQHKQASDDEDNEIEIVEPKTDTIDLDSDNEDQDAVTSSANASTAKSWNVGRPVTISAVPASKDSNTNENEDDLSSVDEMTDFMDTAHNILASMLEIDIVEGNDIIMPIGPASSKKQPRKKTTSKPNPTLLKQKKIIEFQKLDDIKRTDVKLKSECVILVRRAEKEFPYTVGILKQRYERRKEAAKKLAAEKALQEVEEAPKNDDDKIPNENGAQEKSNEQVDKTNDKDKVDADNADNTESVEKQANIDKSESTKDNEVPVKLLVDETEKPVKETVSSEKQTEEKETIPELEDQNEPDNQNKKQETNSKDDMQINTDESISGKNQINSDEPESLKEKVKEVDQSEKETAETESGTDKSLEKNDHVEKLKETAQNEEENAETDKSLENKNDQVEKLKAIADGEEEFAKQSKESPIIKTVEENKETKVNNDNLSTKEVDNSVVPKNKSVLVDNESKSAAQSSKIDITKSSNEQEVMQTDEDENKDSNDAEKMSSQSTSSTVNNEQQLKIDSIPVTQAAQTDRTKETQAQAEDIEMIAEPNTDVAAQSSCKSDKSEVAATQNDKDDHNMDSKQDDAVSPMDVDTSADVFSESTIDIDSSLKLSNAALEESVEQNTSLASSMPPAITVVTESNN